MQSTSPKSTLSSRNSLALRRGEPDQESHGAALQITARDIGLGHDHALLRYRQPLLANQDAKPYDAKPKTSTGLTRGNERS